MSTYNMHLVFGMLSSGGRGFFSHFRLRGKQGVRRYITTHVRILAELRGGALSIQCRSTVFFCQWVVFRFAAQDERVHGKHHFFRSSK